MRLATGGSGVLQPGALHPDLVDVSAEAAARRRSTCSPCASVRSTMPAVDITFGEFLRAIITADTDAVPTDDRATGWRSWRRSANAASIPAICERSARTA